MNTTQKAAIRYLLQKNVKQEFHKQFMGTMEGLLRKTPQHQLSDKQNICLFTLAQQYGYLDVSESRTNNNRRIKKESIKMRMLTIISNILK